MPFITQNRRVHVDKEIDALIDVILRHSKTGKELSQYSTYAFYKVLKRLFSDESCGWYEKMDAIKVLESAKQAFNDYVIKPHEDKKREENGDVV